MQKAIRISAILSAALVGFSLVLLVGSLPLQRTLAQSLSYSEDLIGMLPIFPVIPFLCCFLTAGCIALLIICCGNKKGGIWLEILVIVALAIILPLINTAASTAYAGFIGRFSGTAKLAAASLVSKIASFCCYPANWGQALAYITCGMSIAFKAMSKKQNPEP